MTKLVFLLCFTLFITSCKYKLSTYTAETPEQKLNSVNLQRIKAQESSAPADFKIAFIADTHNYFDELDELIKKINSNGPYAFVIICGDVSNLGLLEEFDLSRRFFNKFKFPYLVSVGNHDLVANGDIITKKMFGKSDFDFTYKGAHFILFDNNNWENSSPAPDVSWIRQKLSESATTTKILVAHVSPDDRDRFSDTDIRDFSMLVDNFNVNYFFHGHNHTPNESIFGNAVKITVGAPSKGSYYELIFSGGGISHQKVNF